jgi:hypothetical protein
MGVNGHDILTGGGGHDTFVIATAGTSLDNVNNATVITDWSGSTDSIHFAGAATTGAGHFLGTDTVVATSMTNALAQANTDYLANAGDHYIAIQVNSDVVVFADTNHDGAITTADDAVILTGRSLTDIAGSNLI